MRKFSIALPLFVAVGLTAQVSAQVTGPVPLAWRFTGTTTQSPAGAPIIQGDNVYIAVGTRVYCLDIATGNRKWQAPAIDPIDGLFNSNMLMLDDTIYASASNKTLYAIDPSNGNIKWTYVAPGAIIGAPISAGKQVVLNIDGRSFMAVSAETGKPSFQTPERVFNGIRGNIFTVGTDVFYFTQRMELYSTNVSTRKATLITRFSLLPSNNAPQVFGNNIYAVSGNNLVSIRPSGAPRFQKNLGKTLVFGPAVSAEGIAVVSDDGTMILLDTNGSPKTIPGSKGKEMRIDLGSRPITAPSVVGKLYAVATANGAINLVDPAKGELVWSYTIRPVTAGLKVSSSSGSGPATGTGRSSGSNQDTDLISIPAAGPVVGGGNSMFVLATDGSLLCFDGQNGVDLTGPSVKVIWPAAGLQISTTSTQAPQDIYFQLADDATGINEKSIKVTLNGKSLDYTFSRDGVLTLRFGPGTKNGTLQDGRAVIEITVADWMGNVTTSKTSYMIDNTLPPLTRPGGQPGSGPGGAGGGRGGATSG